MKILRSPFAGIFLLLVATLNPIESFAANCSFTSSSCTDSTPCKSYGGYQVCLGNVNPLPAGALQIPQTCWATSQTYTCSAPTYTVDTCSTLKSNPDCGVISSTCTATDPTTGACLTYSDLYSCQAPAVTTSNTDCSGLTFCSGGTCFTKKDAPNTSLAKVVAAPRKSRERQAITMARTESLPGRRIRAARMRWACRTAASPTQLADPSRMHSSSTN